MTDQSDMVEVILKLVQARGPGKTICPSEAARACRNTGWQKLMPEVRRAAVALARAGRIGIYRKGRPADPGNFRGVYRLGLPAGSPSQQGKGRQSQKGEEADHIRHRGDEDA